MLMLVNLLLMLLYLNIDYADTNEDLCIRIMSLSGTSINFFLVGDISEIYTLSIYYQEISYVILCC